MTEPVSRVIIHFGNGRTSVIEPSSEVQAIFLEDAADQFVLSRKDNGQEVARKRIFGPPNGVRILPEASVGPRGVCYLVGGVLECWRED